MLIYTMIYSIFIGPITIVFISFFTNLDYIVSITIIDLSFFDNKVSTCFQPCICRKLHFDWFTTLILERYSRMTRVRPRKICCGDFQPDTFRLTEKLFPFIFIPPRLSESYRIFYHRAHFARTNIASLNRTCVALWGTNIFHIAENIFHSISNRERARSLYFFKIAPLRTSCVSCNYSY